MDREVAIRPDAVALPSPEHEVPSIIQRTARADGLKLLHRTASIFARCVRVVHWLVSLTLRKGVCLMVAASIPMAASAQTARDIRGPTPLLAIENEPPPRLIVDPPLPGPLAAGRVFIQYRTENIRIVPVFGTGALQVSPRLGHVHITVDKAPWHFVDASGETIILVGLEPGPHDVLIQLADPTHKVITQQVVSFVIPPVTSPNHH